MSVKNINKINRQIDKKTFRQLTYEIHEYSTWASDIQLAIAAWSQFMRIRMQLDTNILELTYQTQQIEFETGRGYIAAIAVTVIYLVLALIVSTLMSVAARSVRRAA